MTTRIAGGFMSRATRGTWLRTLEIKGRPQVGRPFCNASEDNYRLVSRRPSVNRTDRSANQSTYLIVGCWAFFAIEQCVQEHELHPRDEQSIGSSPISQHPPLCFFLKKVARIAKPTNRTTIPRIIQLARFTQLHQLLPLSVSQPSHGLSAWDGTTRTG